MVMFVVTLSMMMMDLMMDLMMDFIAWSMMMMDFINWCRNVGIQRNITAMVMSPEIDNNIQIYKF